MARIEELLQRRTDLSTFLVHLTRASESSGAFDNLKSIIRTCTLTAGRPLGPAAHLEQYLAGSVATQKTVCLTETPLEHIWMMLESIDGRAIQFEPYGLAITKTTGRKEGFNPVWYSDISRRGYDWPIKAVNNLVADAVSRSTSEGGEVNSELLRQEPILRVTPYFEQMGPTVAARKEFWWEREWRRVGDFYMSFPSRVVTLLAPEAEHAELERFLVALDEEQNTKWIKRPILDPTWGLERMIAALARVPDDHIGPFPNVS